MKNLTQIAEGVVATRYWSKTADNRVQCDLCPRACAMHEGQRGMCYVRQNLNQQIVMTSYGRSSGFAIDPIEKKPLYHFYPGSEVLSFGTAGCNLACKFCQNWHISKSREVEVLSSKAQPQAIARTAKDKHCRSVAYTYNDPVVFHEYAIDTAQACRELGVKSVAVTAGYVNSAPREEFYQWMDAANVDLKAFTDRFYYRLTGSHLQPVLETLLYIKQHTNVWLELTTLLIPGENDSEAELQAMTQWVVENLGRDVPMHFSAFHPAWKMQNTPRTPIASLKLARQIAINNGVRHAYLGNVRDKSGSSTYCQQCGSLLIGRLAYQLAEWNLTEQGACRFCGAKCSGWF